MADIIKKYPFSVLYEDNHLLVINKPAGYLVQGDQTKDKPLVEIAKDYIAEKYDKPGKVFCGVVHRLDRPVSGVLIFARTSKGLERMNALFRKREIYKTYWAVVKKRPKIREGKLVHYLKKDPKKNITKAYEGPVEDAQKAELTYKTLGKLNDHWLIEVNPITGRPHQIRVQLAAMGCPIRGDIKYGFSKKNPEGNINLHARRIDFVHPVKKEKIMIKAPLPETQFWEQFLQLDDKLKNKDIEKLLKNES